MKKLGKFLYVTWYIVTLAIGVGVIAYSLTLP